MGSGRGVCEPVRRGIRTVFFMMLMLGSLVVCSAPVFIATADILIPWALLSALPCRVCGGFSWSKYSFTTSFCDFPLISFVRSFVIICVYSLCDLPGLSNGPYFFTASICSLLSIGILAAKVILFFRGFEMLQASLAAENSIVNSESLHRKYLRCLLLLSLSSLFLALGHIVAAYRTSCKARRKLFFHGIDIEAVLSGKSAVFHGHQKVPRSPLPKTSKSSTAEAEEKKPLLYEEKDLPPKMFADTDSCFIQCEGILVHYKIAYGEKGLCSLTSNSLRGISKGRGSVTPGRLRTDNPFSNHAKSFPLSRSYCYNNKTDGSLYSPLLSGSVTEDTDRAFDSFSGDNLGSTQSLSELNVEYHKEDPSTHAMDCGEDISSGKEKNNIDAIILVHGFGGGVFSWRHVMIPLARQTGCPVVAFDRPGWGLTSRPVKSEWKDKNLHNPYDLQSQVRLLFSLCQEMGFSSVLLVGHDDGALLSLMAADKTNSIITDNQVAVKGVAAIGYSPSRDVVPRFTKILLHTSLAQHILRPLLRTEISQVANRRAWYDATKLTTDVLALYKAPLHVEGWFRALQEISKHSSSYVLQGKKADEFLRKLGYLPVLIASGAEDVLVPLKSAHLLATKLSNSTLLPICGCGHLPHEECPEALLAALLPFWFKVSKKT